MGVRAEARLDRLVTICEGHSEPGMKAGYVWCTQKANREACREYLRGLYPLTYADFLTSKRPLAHQYGPTEPGETHPLLFPFQRDLVRWAVRKGRAALFARHRPRQDVHAARVGPAHRGRADADRRAAVGRPSDGPRGLAPSTDATVTYIRDGAEPLPVSASRTTRWSSTSTRPTSGPSCSMSRASSRRSTARRASG